MSRATVAPAKELEQVSESKRLEVGGLSKDSWNETDLRSLPEYLPESESEPELLHRSLKEKPKLVQLPDYLPESGSEPELQKQESKELDPQPRPQSLQKLEPEPEPNPESSQETRPEPHPETLQEERSPGESLQKASSQGELLQKASSQSEPLQKASSQSESLQTARSLGEPLQKASSQSESLQTARSLGEPLQKASSQSESLQTARSLGEPLQKASSQSESLRETSSQDESLLELSSYSESLPEMGLYGTSLQQVKPLPKSLQNMDEVLEAYLAPYTDSNGDYELPVPLRRSRTQLSPSKEALELSPSMPPAAPSREKPAPKKPRLHTDCLEARLSRAFHSLGWAVGAHPWIFLLGPLLVTMVLGSGLMFLSSDQEEDLEALYTPVGSPAKAVRLFVQEHFTYSNDSCSFSYIRESKEVNFVSILVISNTDTVLDRATLSEIKTLDNIVQGLSVTMKNGSHFSYRKLCAVDKRRCVPSNPFLFAWRVNTNMDLKSLTYPIHNQSGQPIYLAGNLGGVTLGQSRGVNRLLLKAKAMKLIYFLVTEDREYNEHSKKWLVKFLDQFEGIFKSLALKNIQVVYFTSLSRKLEFEATSKTVMPLFHLGYILTMVFAVISCYRVNCIQNKMWVAAFGVITVALAVVTSFGLLLYIGVPFVLIVANSPFLILGVGVDDIFIMISAWQKTSLGHNIEERMANAYSKVAVPITMNTVTNVLASYTWIMSSFSAIRYFCIYTGTSLIFCSLYSITCFGAVMALDGKREVTCLQHMTKSNIKCNKKSQIKKLCCYSVDSTSEDNTENHPIHLFFRDHLGPFLFHPRSKIVVMVLYALYMTCSIFGCLQVKEDLDLRNMASDSSYIRSYINVHNQYFSYYGPRVMVVVNGTIAYWNKKTREKLEKCLKDFENNDYADEHLTEFWLQGYTQYMEANTLDVNNKNVFINNIDKFFNTFPDFMYDLNITSSHKIISSRAFIQTKRVSSSSNQTTMLSQFRSIANSCEIPLLVYNHKFIYYEHFPAIIENAIRNVIATVVIMFLVSLLFIPHPVCSLWVVLAFASVIVGVTGSMIYLDVNMDSISMVTLIICTGFSFRFSAYICYLYACTSMPSAEQKSIEALYLLGYPVLQCALSTVLCTCGLAAAKAYVFRMFSKIMFLVMAFGALHGLIFIPVFLTCVDCLFW